MECADSNEIGNLMVDYEWLKVINKDFYKKQIEDIGMDIGYCRLYNNIDCSYHGCKECYKILRRDKRVLSMLGAKIKKNNNNLE